jgi:sugar phosphate permease
MDEKVIGHPHEASQQKPVSEPSTLEPPTQVRYHVLAAVCALALIAYIHRVGFAQGGTNLKRDLGLNDQEWGYVMAAFLLAYGAFEIPWGLLGDWLGARHLLTLVTLGWSIVTAGTALVMVLPNVTFVDYALLQFAFLVGLRFLFGMFQAGAFPAISRVTADWIPMQERATAQGLVWMCSRVGGALAPFLIVWQINVLGGWESTFVTVSVLGLLWCAVFWPWFRNRPEEMPQVNAAERQRITAGRAAKSAGHGAVPWSKVLRSRSVWALCFMYGCGGFAANFFVTYLPSYLANQRQLLPDEVKVLTSLPLACGVVGCVLGGFLSDWIIRTTGNRKWGRRLNGTVGTIIAGLAYLFINWAQDTKTLAALLCVIFFCNDLAMGPAWASCADIGRRYAGTLGGAMNMVGNVAGAVAQGLAGNLFHRGHPELVFIIFGCTFFLGTLCWQGVDVTKPIEEDA